MIVANWKAVPRGTVGRPSYLNANPWSATSYGLALLLFAPIASVFIAATGDSDGLWGHLFETVFPRYVANTLILMLGVGALSLVFGVGTAWVVTRYSFPGSAALEWMLLLPAAVPAYIIAYTYTDFLEYAGPVQGTLRDAFGWRSVRDYWFPEIRSMGGAILVMGSVLYPYVYMMARTALKLTPASLFEVARLHRRSIFWAVGLPLARPAIVAGLALVLMETISDFGTVEFFALETLTLGIFNVWLGMNSLPVAAQISAVSFLFIIALLVLELRARAQRRYTGTAKRAVGIVAQPVVGARAFGCIAVCLLPVSLGFFVPVGVLLNFVLRGYSLSDYGAVFTVMLNSLTVAGLTAVAVMAISAFMVIVMTYRPSRLQKIATMGSAIGYAVPGTILAIGVVTFIGALEDAAALIAAGLGHDGFRGLLSGTIALIVIACMVRFQAVGFGAMSSGINRLPPNMMAASRVLGQGFAGSLRRVIVPLLRTSFIAGGLLVFVDVMKELPMTLLLRPFNFETLATYVYQFAKDELLEEAALPALCIVLAGVCPVVIMNAALRRYGGN